MKFLKLKYDSSFRKILISSFIGVFSHIVLDSFLYSDIKPFFPSNYNPLLGLFNSLEIYLFCTITILFGFFFTSLEELLIKNLKELKFKINRICIFKLEEMTLQL